jgi:hypothetical protein
MGDLCRSYDKWGSMSLYTIFSLFTVIIIIRVPNVWVYDTETEVKQFTNNGNLTYY